MCKCTRKHAHDLSTCRVALLLLESENRGGGLYGFQIVKGGDLVLEVKIAN